MKRYILMAVIFFAAGCLSTGQESTVALGENLVVEGVPKIPASLSETVGRYTENRDAFQTDWHPTRREMIIGTRFANTYQAHIVAMPQGARRQLTFFPEPVYGGSFGRFTRREGTTSSTQRTLVEANGTSSSATTWLQVRAHS